MVVSVGNEEISAKKAGMAGVWQQISAQEQRLSALEGGHKGEGNPESLITCPTCYAKTSPGDYPKHYDSHQKKQEKPRVIMHPFSYGVGFCKDCNQMEARDLPQVISHLPELVKYIREKSDAKFECKDCHLPITDPKSVEKCLNCGSSQAIKSKLKF